jgi:glycosyltransferase involved in cell wall biosynthesis
MKVSVLLLTHNEESNISSCLAALAWCDDVVVVDSGSTDRTVEIARSHGARILLRPFDDFAHQRNFGLEHGEFRNEWVLHLDADEIVTAYFIEQMNTLIAPLGVDAWRVPSKTMLLGQWLRHAGMYPSYQVRLGLRDRLRFQQVGHGQREALSPERIATFPEPYLHYNFSHGMRRWLEKHVRYARDEARLILQDRSGVTPTDGQHDVSSRRRTLKRLASHLPLWLRPGARMFYILVVRQGIRDGRAGLFYALMLAIYEGMIAVFAYDLILGGTHRNVARSEAVVEASRIEESVAAITAPAGGQDA